MSEDTGTAAKRWSARRAMRAHPTLIALALGILVLSIAVHAVPLNAFDRAVTHAVQSLRTPLLDRCAIAFTFLGNTSTIVAMAILSAATLYAFGRKVEAALTLLALALLPANYLLKILIHRERPNADVATIVLPAVGLSFPSGHAMGSAIFFGCLAYCAWVIVSNHRLRNLFTGIFLALAATVGMSRVYLGVHWFSDVLGGWTAGAFCIVLLATLYKPLAKLRAQPPALTGDG